MHVEISSLLCYPSGSGLTRILAPATPFTNSVSMETGRRVSEPSNDEPQFKVIRFICTYINRQNIWHCNIKPVMHTKYPTAFYNSRVHTTHNTCQSIIRHQRKYFNHTQSSRMLHVGGGLHIKESHILMVIIGYSNWCSLTASAG